MSDIKHKFILEASLDDSRLQQDLRKLKASFGKLDIGRNDVDVLRDAFKNITKQFSQDIQAALKKGQKSGAGAAGGYNYLKYKDAGKLDSQKDLDLQLKKKTESELKLQDKLKRQEQLSFQKREREELRQTMRVEKVRDQSFNRRITKAKREGGGGSFLNYSNPQQALRNRLASKHGSQGGEDDSKFIDSMFNSITKSRMGKAFANFMGNKAVGTAIGAAGAVGAIGAGVIGAAGVANQFSTLQRQTRTGEAGQAQEQANFLRQGQFLQGNMAQSARKDQQTGFSGLVSGLGGVSDKLFSMSIADKVSIITGDAYKQGQLQQGEQERDTRLAQTQLAGAAQQRAFAQVGGRVNLQRGGGISDADITGAQAGGASRGFSAEETLNQLQQARQSIGNQASASLINQLQTVQNQTGIGVSQQAQGIELLSGATGGSAAASSQAQIEILKKGVASGLDVSKSGKFLQSTSEFIKNTQGLNTMDVGGATDRLASFASGFAGGGPVTQTSLDQARQLANIQQSESTSESGLAGVNNIAGIQKAFSGAGQNLDSGTLLALSGLDQNATDDQFAEILKSGGVSGDAIGGLTESIRGVKAKGAEGGAAIAGLDPNSNLGRSLIARERGIGTRDQLGIERARAVGSVGQGDLGTGPSGASFQTAQQQAAISVTETSKGMDLLTTSAGNASKNLETFNSQLQSSIDKLREFQSEMQATKN